MTQLHDLARPLVDHPPVGPPDLADLERRATHLRRRRRALGSGTAALALVAALLVGLLPGDDGGQVTTTADTPTGSSADASDLPPPPPMEESPLRIDVSPGEVTEPGTWVTFTLVNDLDLPVLYGTDSSWDDGGHGNGRGFQLARWDGAAWSGELEATGGAWTRNMMSGLGVGPSPLEPGASVLFSTELVDASWDADLQQDVRSALAPGWYEVSVPVAPLPEESGGPPTGSVDDRLPRGGRAVGRLLIGPPASGGGPGGTGPGVATPGEAEVAPESDAGELPQTQTTATAAGASPELEVVSVVLVLESQVVDASWVLPTESVLVDGRVLAASFASADCNTVGERLELSDKGDHIEARLYVGTWAGFGGPCSESEEASTSALLPDHLADGRPVVWAGPVGTVREVVAARGDWAAASTPLPPSVVPAATSVLPGTAWVDRDRGRLAVRTRGQGDQCVSRAMLVLQTDVIDVPVALAWPLTECQVHGLRVLDSPDPGRPVLGVD